MQSHWKGLTDKPVAELFICQHYQLEISQILMNLKVGEKPSRAELTTMDNLADHQRIGGENVRIGDCYVWAEINYLDSPTDYREYLPKNCARPRNIPCNDLVVLESHASPRSSKAKQWSPWLAFLFILSLFLPMISWFLFRLLDLW